MHMYELQTTKEINITINHMSKSKTDNQERIFGEGFLLFSGIGTGSFGLLRNFLVEIGFTSTVSERLFLTLLRCWEKVFFPFVDCKSY